MRIIKREFIFSCTNGTLLEWLNSPIRYREEGTFAQSLRALAPEYINSVALCYHYSHMARSNARSYLFEDKVRLKKYFYVLRPLLAIRYIEAGLGVPPVRFTELVNRVAPPHIKPAIAQLLALKAKALELGLGEQYRKLVNLLPPSSNATATPFPGKGGQIYRRLPNCSTS